jgi:hypothetical protein
VKISNVTFSLMMTLSRSDLAAAGSYIPARPLDPDNTKIGSGPARCKLPTERYFVLEQQQHKQNSKSGMAGKS